MGDSGIGALLEGLRSPNSRQTWTEFLERYSSVLFQTARAWADSEDTAADCYLHICQQLAHSGFRRLLKFRPDGRASFTTWLRVVARNLCFDWHRSQIGRHRPFKSLQRLSQLELEVYTCRITRGLSEGATLQQLQVTHPGVSVADLATIESRVQNSLSSHQQWILSTRQQPAASQTVAVLGEDTGQGVLDVADTRPDQETQMLTRQQHAQLKKYVAALPASERLLLQLRFEQELSLDEIARLTELGDAQRVHRHLATTLGKLRSKMS